MKNPKFPHSCSSYIQGTQPKRVEGYPHAQSSISGVREVSLTGASASSSSSALGSSTNGVDFWEFVHDFSGKKLHIYIYINIHTDVEYNHIKYVFAIYTYTYNMDYASTCIYHQALPVFSVPNAMTDVPASPWRLVPGALLQLSKGDRQGLAIVTTKL